MNLLKALSSLFPTDLVKHKVVIEVTPFGGSSVSYVLSLVRITRKANEIRFYRTYVGETEATVRNYYWDRTFSQYNNDFLKRCTLTGLSVQKRSASRQGTVLIKVTEKPAEYE